MRGTSLIIIIGWPLYRIHGIAVHGVALTEIIKELGQRGELRRMLEGLPSEGLPHGEYPHLLNSRSERKVQYDSERAKVERLTIRPHYYKRCSIISNPDNRSSQ
jgi:hypothetical protein